MSKSDLVKNLGTIAHSGARSSETLPGSNAPQTAQFGLGFYSVFKVADKVQAISKTEDGEQFMWESLSENSFTVRSCDGEQLNRGTQVILHLKKEYAEFLLPSVLEDIIHKYVGFIGFPIKLISDLQASGNEERLINDVQLVWMQDPAEVNHEDYVKVYKYLSTDPGEPFSIKHFSCSGEISMRGVLFISRHHHKDTANHGVKVYLNHVLLTDCLDTLFEDLPHEYLYGVIDLFNLRLTLGSSGPILRKECNEIYRRLLNVFLEWFKECSENEEAYSTVCENLKPLLLFLYCSDARFAGFLRYCSSKSGNPKISLDEYISRMKKDQRTIYFALGENIGALRDSPAAEKLHQSGIEVLYTSNPADYLFISNKNYYKLYKIRNVESYFTDIYLSKEDEQEYRESCMEFAATCSTIESYLSVNGASVRVSRRLVDSPCCAFVDGEMAFGKPLKSKYFKQARIDLEINPNHEILIRLKELCSNNDVKLGAFASTINVLFETALIDSGFMPPDPIQYSDMVYELIRASLNVSKATEMPKETEERALHDTETSTPVLAADKGGDVDWTS